MQIKLLYIKYILFCCPALLQISFGQQFTKIISADNPNFSQIYFIDETTGWEAGFDGKIYKSTDGGYSWQKYSTPTIENVNSICFINASIGFAGCDNKTLLKTNDGGISWSIDSLINLQSGYDINVISFIDENNGWILANFSGSSESGMQASILSTTDGGKNWSADFTLNDAVLNNLSINKSKCGIAVGTNISNIYYTKDGKTWLNSVKPDLGGVPYSRTDIKAAFVTSGNIAYASGWGSYLGSLQPSIHLKSTDNGETWKYLSQSESNRTYDNIFGVYFKDDNNGIAVGGAAKGSVILKTSDGGFNWMRINAPFGSTLQSISSVGNKIWVSGALGLLLLSEDFGETWKMLSPLPSNSINTIQFTKSGIGFAAGQNGLFLKSVDNGRNWFSSFITVGYSTLNILDMQFLDDNVGYAAHNFGMVSKTTNGGINWFSVLPENNSVPNINYALDFVDNNCGFVVGRLSVGNDVIYKTTDGGINWSIKTNVANNDLRDVKFFNSMDGLVVGDELNIFFTSDGGDSWNKSEIKDIQEDLTSSGLRKISLLNSTEAVVVGDGIILKSTDKGSTWNYISSPALSLLNSLFFLNEAEGYAGSQSELFKTTDSGLTWDYLIDTVLTDAPVYAISGDKNNNLWIGSSNSTIYTSVNSTNVTDIIPEEYSFYLYQNFPNPFNSCTTIKYRLNAADNVTIKVYDVLGNEVALLLDSKQEKGEHSFSFDTRKFNLASGSYFLSAEVRNKKEVRKFILLK